MAVDEKRAGAWIFDNAEFLVPLAVLFLAHYVLTANAWLTYPAFVALGFAFAARGHDTRVLFALSAISLVCTALFLGDISLSNRLSEYAYLFLISGFAALAAGFAREGRANAPKTPHLLGSIKKRKIPIHPDGEADGFDNPSGP